MCVDWTSSLVFQLWVYMMEMRCFEMQSMSDSNASKG